MTTPQDLRSARQKIVDDLRAYSEWAGKPDVLEIAVEALSALSSSPAGEVSLPEPSQEEFVQMLDLLCRQSFRMGELWERCQGKFWPEDESRSFNTLRDDQRPKLLTRLRTYGDQRAAAERATHSGEYAALIRLRAEIVDLRAGLKFYADGNHFIKGDEDAWDTVSGEPQNFWCDSEGLATVEDGTIAGRVLIGELTAKDFEETDDDEA